MSTRTGSDWSTWGSAFAASASVLYGCGYLIHIVNARLLGIDWAGQPLDYIRLAGEYIVWLLISSLELIRSARLYIPTVFKDALLAVAIISCAVSAWLQRSEWARRDSRAGQMARLGAGIRLIVAGL